MYVNDLTGGVSTEDAISISMQSYLKDGQMSLCKWNTNWRRNMFVFLKDKSDKQRGVTSENY